MILLSVVVPMYNPGIRLVPFLDSLLNQKMKNIEIIIINDGSTDGSGDIVSNYSKSNKNIRVYNQMNKGVSESRNIGLKKATGKYIAFPDSDDILHHEMYSTLVSLAEENNLDVAQCNGERYFSDADERKIIFPKKLRTTEVLSGPDWFEKALESKRFIHVVWLAIYRLNLIKEKSIFFEPGLHHQDIPWTTEILFNSNRVKYISTPLYLQNVHSESISNRVRIGMENVEYQRHYMKIIKILENKNKVYGLKIKIRSAFKWQITREALGICHSIRREPCRIAQKIILTEFHLKGIHKTMLKNARGIKQIWQVLLWLNRLRAWRV